ncbi:MAG: 16S rRNA (cytosine(967)-C(5))-methyltransferase RsmB [Clostridia bacterium]|nr:16S rRNA (cytosine(967)-C(5))-methyltransferase RsmB [Clostridia bacterium]
MLKIDYARDKALVALTKIVVDKQYSNTVLWKALNDGKLEERDKRFIKELVYGTLENMIFIDLVFKKFSKIPIKGVSVKVLNIIRLGIYQILFLDKVPDSAACDESVNLVKKYNKKAAGFTNAVLRNISRNKSNISYPDKKKSKIKYLSVKYSYPIYILNLWLHQFDFEFVEQLCIDSNKRAPVTIRVNTLKTDKKGLKNKLQQKGIIVYDGLYNDESLVLEKAGDILGLEEYKTGLFIIQDESSMLVSKALNPQKGEKILDMCSAPGGKTTHIAQLMENCGQIVARDINISKIKAVKQNCSRLGIKIVDAQVVDALALDDRSEEMYDRVLVDAPCSGLGVIRKKPDIKINKEYDDFEKLKSIQKRILKNASKYLKENGVLVYSTCTINREENQDIIDDFLKYNDNFYLCDLSNELGIGKTRTLNLYPNIHRVDGFFIAKLKKLK